MRWLALVGIVGALAGCGGNGNTTAGADARVIDAPLVLADGRLADARIVDAAPGGGSDGQQPMVNDGGQPLCNGDTGLVVCECSDGKNNDSDSFIDSADPE